MAMTPYDVHDMHPDRGNKPNADGTYFDPEMGAIVKKKPEFNKHDSTGYFGVSDATQEKQEREACIQIGVACIGMALVFSFVGFAFWIVFKGMEPGFNAEFLTFCAIIGSIV